MTKHELRALIEEELRALPERMSGNDVNATVAERLRELATHDREPLIEVVRDYLSVRIPSDRRGPADGVREARQWLALEVAERLALRELVPDVASLLHDAQSGRTLLPIYERVIAKYLSSLRGW